MPLLGALLIAVSRCQDYRHDVWDVCAGAALGMALGVWSYRRFWPRLSGPDCQVPYPPPDHVADGHEEDGAGGSGGWTRVRDEEEGQTGQGLDGMNGAYELVDLGKRDHG
jgi:diacylglycerol diphosphate phosphatase/phosphatidate phosphatase